MAQNATFNYDMPPVEDFDKASTSVKQICKYVQDIQALLRRMEEDKARLVTEMNEMKDGKSQDKLLSNKKDDDNNYDLEAALVSGGSAGFMPLAGLIRSAPTLLQLRLFIMVAQAVDKVTIAVHTRPATRLVFWLYTLILHFFVLFSVI